MTQEPSASSGLWGDPCMVMVAPNGARRTKVDHPALPITPGEVASTAAACAEAGAGAIHLHVRDADEAHIIDPDAYRTMLAAVRDATAGRLVMQITTEAVGRFTPQEQMGSVRALTPESASIAVRELIPPDSPDAHLAEVETFLDWCLQERVAVQYIVYDPIDLERFNTLRARGVIPDSPALLQFVLGRYTPNQVSQPSDLLPFLGVLREEDIWSVCAFGPLERAALVGAASLGGHARVGFENNVYRAEGTVAVSNAEQVAGLVAAISSLGRRTATADDIRVLFDRLFV